MKHTEKICRQDKGHRSTGDIKKAQRKAERRERKRMLRALGEDAERDLRRRYVGWST